MSSSKSLPARKQKASSKTKVPRARSQASDPALLGFDLLFQLAHMASIAAAGVSRAKIMSMAASIPTSTAHYFEEVDRVATSMNFPYAEACRVVGMKAKDQEVRGFLLRFASALNTGEAESEFLEKEAHIQAEAYGNVYERGLETLKKWTDAFTALIVSAALIIVVATVSTMIYDLGTRFVGGLVVAMIFISLLGVWVIYRSSPREIRTLRGEAGMRSQGKVRKAATLLLPLGLMMVALATIMNINLGVALLLFAALLFPVGIMSRRLDKRVSKYDEDIATFVRVLGATVSSIGTTPVIALSRMDMRSMPSLVEGVRRLRTRLVARVSPELSWKRFVEETGSELVGRTMRVFLDGVSLGGDADEVGRRASLLGMKMNQLRAKRALVADSFSYLSFAMQAVIAFLLIFIVEVVNGFNDLIATAGVEVPGGPGAALGGVLAFNSANLEFLRTAMVPVILVLAVVNALAPKIADGGFSHSFFYFFGFTLSMSGIALLVAPVLASVIFGASEIAQ